MRATMSRIRRSNVTAVGAPFAYLVRGLEPVRSTGDDVVVLPYHGLRNGAERGAAEGLVERAAEREGADRIVVYLHYNELQDSEIRAKIDRLGVRTQTFWPHGKRSLYDPLMLSRQMTRFLSASKVVSNTACTPLWYAAYLGVVPEVYGPEPRRGSLNSGMARSSRESRIRWPHMYVDSADYDSQASLDASWRELGGNLLLSPSELSEVLGFTSPARRLGAMSIDRIAFMRRRARTVLPRRPGFGALTGS